MSKPVTFALISGRSCYISTRQHYLGVMLTTPKPLLLLSPQTLLAASNCETRSRKTDTLLSCNLAMSSVSDLLVTPGLDHQPSVSTGKDLTASIARPDELRHITCDSTSGEMVMDSDISLRLPCNSFLAKRRKFKTEKLVSSSNTQVPETSSRAAVEGFQHMARDLTVNGGSANNATESYLVEDYTFQTEALAQVQQNHKSSDYVMGGFQNSHLQSQGESLSSKPYKENLQFKHPSTSSSSSMMRNQHISMTTCPSPLAVPSPNWSAVEKIFGPELLNKTPKLLDGSVFDFLSSPPLTPRVSSASSLISKTTYLPSDDQLSPRDELESYSGHDQVRPPRLSPRFPIPVAPTDLSAKNNDSDDVLPESLLVSTSRKPCPDDVQDLSTNKSSRIASLDLASDAWASQLGLLMDKMQGFTVQQLQWPSPTAKDKIPSALASLQPAFATNPLLLVKLANPSLTPSEAVSAQEEMDVSENKQSNPEEPTETKGGKVSVSENNSSMTRKQKNCKRGTDQDKKADSKKRVYTCPHCKRSYEWNYNLNRHLKYECGKENAFQCSQCGRKFPHKQNCVYHIKRKHKIICKTNDQYLAARLVLFQPSGVPGESKSSPKRKQ